MHQLGDPVPRGRLLPRFAIFDPCSFALPVSTSHDARAYTLKVFSNAVGIKLKASSSAKYGEKILGATGEYRYVLSPIRNRCRSGRPCGAG
jgi:hypothetical protein